MPNYYRIKLFTKKFDDEIEQKEEMERRDYCFNHNLFAIGWPVPVEGKVEDIKDYEELAKHYDAILYIRNKELDCPGPMYSWDCDSLLVFNPDVVVEE